MQAQSWHQECPDHFLCQILIWAFIVRVCTVWPCHLTFMQRCHTDEVSEDEQDGDVGLQLAVVSVWGEAGLQTTWSELFPLGEIMCFW